MASIPEPAALDLSPVYRLLADPRWLVRNAAIRALDNAACAEAEQRLIQHLTATSESGEQVYCHATLAGIGTLASVPTIEANLRSRKRDVKETALAALAAIRSRHESSGEGTSAPASRCPGS